MPVAGQLVVDLRDKISTPASQRRTTLLEKRPDRLCVLFVSHEMSPHQQ